MNLTPDRLDADEDVSPEGEAQIVEPAEVTETVEAVEVTEITESDSIAVADAEALADADAEPVDPDPALLEAHDLALAALREITPEATIGEPAGYRVERDGVVSLRFANRMAGYPGWYWTVSVARVDGAEPTVLEAELLPGDGALLAPDWVPWAVRLAEYHAAQAAAAEAAHAEEDDSDEPDADDIEDLDDLDAADFDEDGSPILHAGDLDGVDIDELAEEPTTEESVVDDELDSDEDLDELDSEDEDSDNEDSDALDSDDEDSDDEDFGSVDEDVDSRA